MGRDRRSFISFSLPSPSPLFSFGLIAIRSLRGRATRFLSREKGFVCLDGIEFVRDTE